MAMVDYFLKIEGVDGESQDEKHKGEIQLDEWSLVASNSASFASGGGGGVGKVAVQDLQITKKTDKASAKLFTACCTGEHLAKATLVCRKAGTEQQEFLTLVLTPVLVTRFDTSGAADVNVIPTERVWLAFGKIEFKYKEQQTTGGALAAEIVGGWDVQTNKKV